MVWVTKWCTTQRIYYNKYDRNGFLFYIIDKTHNVKFGVPVTTSGNDTQLVIKTLYNNVDKGLRWGTIVDIYGKEITDMLSKAMKAHYREVKLKVVRKKVLESAIMNMRSMKASFARDKVYENTEANKMIDELMNVLVKDLM